MLASTQPPRGGGQLLQGADYSERMREMFAGVGPAQRKGTPLEGSATASAFGAGRIASMRGGPMIIQRQIAAGDATSATFNLLVNVQGSAETEHGARRAELAAGDAVLLDGSRTFAANMRSDYSQLLVQFPRDAVARRHPELIKRAGICFTCEHPALQLLAHTAHLLVSRTLDPIGQSYIYDAMLTMLGALQSTSIEHRSVTCNRFVRALADIDAHLSDTSLSATTLASLQQISRRRLDAIFAARGLTVEQVMWARRLERAASDVADSRKNSRKLLDIALACGFSSEAHFSRRFRAHFGLSPREYRRAGSVIPPSSQGRPLLSGTASAGARRL